MSFLYATTTTTAFRDVLVFFERLGVYDVILPFLLVFTLVFAIFERTKVLGTEVVNDKELPKKNLNAMIAFVIAFLVVASAQIVSIINTAMPMIVILLFLGVFFLLLVGIFYSEKQEVLLGDKWKIMFMVIMFIGILAIFLYAIPMSSGEPFLTWIMEFLARNYNTTAVSSIVLMVVVVGFMLYIIREPKAKKEESKD
ncbi:hypothetical protein COV16_06585 [Candidatus Woesearchaeota archaeon CG10_big_fil_rev_8_21_14_0_10_34_8]|nr:MAG: hypothetical protein COV16_06585 [Candidatus Woesearchaeota archaeon CG10_big_fil_rev_8_21_14_0_10_34_8]